VSTSYSTPQVGNLTEFLFRQRHLGSYHLPFERPAAEGRRQKTPAGRKLLADLARRSCTAAEWAKLAVLIEIETRGRAAVASDDAAADATRRSAWCIDDARTTAHMEAIRH
jgi:hypothetical protein